MKIKIFRKYGPTKIKIFLNIDQNRDLSRIFTKIVISMNFNHNRDLFENAD